jgi:hypothetical protein
MIWYVHAGAKKQIIIEFEIMATTSVISSTNDLLGSRVAIER